MAMGQLDLHDLPAAVARVAVASTLERVRRGGVPFPSSGLTFITGKGMHSESNVAIVKPEIKSMLESAEFSRLNARVPETNPGKLHVELEDLRAWILGAG